MQNQMEWISLVTNILHQLIIRTCDRPSTKQPKSVTFIRLYINTYVYVHNGGKKSNLLKTCTSNVSPNAISVLF